MTPEAAILAAVRCEASRLGAVLFRNNTGTARDATSGRLVRFGLCVGSADLIGWFPRNGVAVFVAIEVKQPGRKPTAEQARFLAAVRAAGGIGAVISDKAQLREVLA